MAGLALLCAAGAILAFAAPGTPAQTAAPPEPPPLFTETCSACHGDHGQGVRGQGPSLVGAGAAAADFYLSTGRMPLANSTDTPVRHGPAFSRAEIDRLVAYIAALGPGPAIPAVDPAAGSIAEGQRSFTEHCAGCHQVVARGGIVTGAIAPALQEATPTQIGEAVRVGPYLMPRFTTRDIPPGELNSIARYVLSTRHPDDRGGWGIGHIGPVPEGMVAWLLAGVALLLVARLIGERTE
jgi:ubiquinol-cytochrome c reductase cytochrome c subunit